MHWRNWLFPTLVFLLSFFLACSIISSFFDVNWGDIWVLTKSFFGGVEKISDSRFLGPGHRLGGGGIGDWFRNALGWIINSLTPTRLSSGMVRNKIEMSSGGKTVLRFFLGSFENWKSLEEVWRLTGFILLDIFFCFKLVWKVIYYPVCWLVSVIRSSFFEETSE